jgi:ribosomal protein S18 acetylase RimI-like enzyme
VELKDFFDKTLPGKSNKQCEKIIKNSSIIIGAFKERELIGIGRALDDGVYGFITDLIVKEQFRGKGVGTNLAKNLVDKLFRKNIKIIHCPTSKKLLSFYKRVASFNFDKDDITIYFNNFTF